MPTPVTFLRLYRDMGAGPEYPATPATVAAVLKSMNAAGDLAPFKVRFRLDDGSAVVCGPRRRRSA